MSDMFIFSGLMVGMLMTINIFRTERERKKYWYRQYQKKLDENLCLHNKLTGECNNVEEYQKELLQYRYFINSLGLVTSLDQEEKVGVLLGKARMLHHTWEITGMEPEGEDKVRLSNIINKLNEDKVSNSDF